MKREGPPLETLLRRLVDTPPDFLAEPRIGNTGVVHVDAVIGDVATRFDTLVPKKQLQSFIATSKDERNRLALALLGAWVYAEAGFHGIGVTPTQMLAALETLSNELAPHAPAKAFHTDADRREELARTALARLDLRPAGESENQAHDRLVSISAAERKRAVEAAKGAVERMRAIREALARKAAQESADKMWRE